MSELRVIRGQTPPCGQCGRPLLLQATALLEVLTLCEACDSGRPHAAALIAWLRSGPANRPTHDLAVMAEAGLLLTEWVHAVMAERGWVVSDTLAP